MEINTKALGTIVEFDPITQWATVKLCHTDFVQTVDSNFFNAGESELIDVPVEFPRCGRFSITFPIQVGDDCIVEFFQSGIDHWQYDDRREYAVDNGLPEDSSRRRFSRDDACCRVSLGNSANPITDFDVENFQIRNIDGTQNITLNADGSMSINATSLEVSAPDITLNATNTVDINTGVLTMTASTINMVKG